MTYEIGFFRRSQQSVARAGLPRSVEPTRHRAIHVQGDVFIGADGQLYRSDELGWSIKKGVKKVGRGIKKGAKATGKGIKTGAKATGKGVKVAAKSTAKVAKKVGQFAIKAAAYPIVWKYNAIVDKRKKTAKVSDSEARKWATAKILKESGRVPGTSIKLGSGIIAVLKLAGTKVSGDGFVSDDFMGYAVVGMDPATVTAIVTAGGVVLTALISKLPFGEGTKQALKTGTALASSEANKRYGTPSTQQQLQQYGVNIPAPKSAAKPAPKPASRPAPAPAPVYEAPEEELDAAADAVEETQAYDDSDPGEW